MPPALVERLPPIWQEPSAASESGKQPVCSVGGGLCVRQNDARLDDHRIRGRIDRADPVEARERYDDLRAGSVRHLTADEAGIAALRHDRRPGLIREFQNRRDLRHRARPEDHRRVPMEQIPAFDQEGRDVVRVAKRIGGADDRREAVDQIAGEGRGGSVHCAGY